MVFPCMDLLQQSTHTGLIRTDNHKQVFAEEAYFSVCIDYLDMREILTVGAHFVLAFNY